MYRTISFSLSLLQSDQPDLCVGYPDLINPSLTEWILLQEMNGGLITCLGGFPDSNLGSRITLYKFKYRQVSALQSDMSKLSDLEFLLQFP